jgi:hypothetical protein
LNIHNWISEILGYYSGLMIFVWTNPGWELPQRLRGWGFSSTTWYLCGASAVLLWPWQGPGLSRRTGRDLGVCDSCVTTGWVNIHNYQLFEGLFGLWKAGYWGEINWCNPKFEQFDNVAILFHVRLHCHKLNWGMLQARPMVIRLRVPSHCHYWTVGKPQSDLWVSSPLF